jgi:crotonobetainyl-CoA:carnitine CoA-transferase CaiB-like acyl-CoA transferase
MGRSDLVEDERTKDVVVRSANRDFVNETILAWTRSLPTRAVVDALAEKVPVGPVQSAADIFADPHVKARGMLVEMEQPGDNAPITVAGVPIKLTRTPAGIYRRPPRLGEHTREILAEAGIDRKEESG